MTEEQFDDIVKQIREEEAPAGQVDAARERVWRHIAGSASLACAEFRPEFGAYLAGQLAESRRLLMEDHLGRCAECRTALAEPKGEQKVQSISRPSQSYRWTRWAVAAGVVLGAFYLSRDRVDSALAPSGPRATVVSVTGALYRLPQTSLQPGATIADLDSVRTTAGSRAILQLADGSRVELNERTELSVQAAWSGQTIRLDRGDVMVQAAKQRRGHLRVVTRDSVASVKGTVFAVSSGAAGSLVSVVEGSVAVSQPGAERLLTAGKQAATNPSLDRVKVRQAISWSQDVEKYYGVLAELIGIEKQLAGVTTPSLRTEARLLRYVPSNAVLYFAIPNLDGAIRQALQLVDQRARENSALNEWWSSDSGQEWKKTLDRIQAVTPLLREEVVFVLAKEPGRHYAQIPFAVAHIQPGRQDALREGIDRIAGTMHEKLPYRIAQDLLVISNDASHLAMLGEQSGALSPFAAEISNRYRRGVGWLLGMDVRSYLPGIGRADADRLLGLLNVRYAFFEQRSGGGREENEATLSFHGSRTGIASWLAAPGSAGSAEYVSSEAVAAFSASTRDPRQALDELLSAVSGIGGDVQKFETETHVSLSGDIGASLGTDFTFAIERPSLPMPGWIAALEVVRPEVLDDAVRRLVDAYNRRTPPERAVTVAQETVNGRTWTSLKMELFPLPIYWTHDRGYLIASTDRALAVRAIANRESGSSLVRSASFQQRFPTTSGLHHSGFFWLNTSGVISQLSGLVENPTLKSLLNSRDPLLVVLDGETEQIRAASRNRLTSLILDAMLVYGQAPSSPGGVISPGGKRDTIDKVLHDTRH